MRRPISPKSAPPAAQSWRRHLPLLLLCLFFAGLYASTLSSLGMLGWDESEYASLGRSVLRGEGFSISGRPDALRPPVLPLAVAASLLVTGSNRDVAAKLPNLAFSVLALLVVYEAMRRERGRLSAWIAAAFLGLMPTFWLFTSMLLTEIPFMVFFTAATVCFYFGLYRDDRFFYGGWICVALALLTRYTAVLFAPIALSFTLIALTDAEARQRIGRRHFWLSPFLGLGLLLPWLLRQQLVFGDALVGFRQASGQLQAYMPGVSMPWYFYPVHLPEMISPLLCLPLLVGIVWAVRARDRFALHCLFVVAFVLLWFSAYRFKEIRMATSTLPFLAMVAALGVTQAIVPRRLTTRWAGVLAVFLIAVLASSFAANRRFFSQAVTLGYPSFTDAMRILRQRTPSSAVLMGASVPQIFWYTERDVVDFPDESEFPASLAQCDWVIVTNFERGQKPYARNLTAKVTRQDVEEGSAAVFQSGQFSTVLIRSALLRERP
jgi:4-amino-4-deoxy-L-arabinose transferase-like glycosyltransferase